MVDIAKRDMTAVILAGGEARRMAGNDKGLIVLNDKPMIAHILTKLEPQVYQIIINANRNLDDYGQYGYPVISDDLTGFCGPLAGVAAALAHCKTDYLLSLPCDSPFIPNDLANRLAIPFADSSVDIAVAHNGERMQPVFCLFKTKLKDSLQAYLDAGERKIDRWFKQHHFVEVDFSDTPNAFMNINTPEELGQAELLMLEIS